MDLTKSILCFESCFIKDACDVSCQGALFDYLSYFVGWMWRVFHRTIHSQAHYGFLTTNWYTYPSLKATSSQQLVEQRFKTWHKSTTMWKASYILPLGFPWQNNHNIHEAFIAKEWNSFHLSRRRLQWLPPPQGFSQMQLVLESTIGHHHNARSLLLTTPLTIDLAFKLYDGRLSPSLQMIDHGTFAPLV